MSTTTTLKYYWDPNKGEGYALYTDYLDTLMELEVVHLELTGVFYKTVSPDYIKITIPLEWARQLGLLDKKDAK